jgi:hypothetical protein
MAPIDAIKLQTDETISKAGSDNLVQKERVSDLDDFVKKIGEEEKLLPAEGDVTLVDGVPTRTVATNAPQSNVALQERQMDKVIKAKIIRNTEVKTPKQEKKQVKTINKIDEQTQKRKAEAIEKKKKNFINIFNKQGKQTYERIKLSLMNDAKKSK